jgi:DNA-binding MarR family transcriptional regulator/GNAT superfamily N-acetyltransferase
MTDSPLLSDLMDLGISLDALGRRAARAVASKGLSEVQARLLIALNPTPMAQADLARFLSMDSGQVARTVGRLVTRGLVERTGGSEASPKGLPLRLTPAGAQAASLAEARKWRAVEESLAETETAELPRIFNACKRLADRHYEDRAGPFVRPAAIGDFGSFMRLAAITMRTSFFGHFDQRVEAHLVKAYLDFMNANNRGIFLVAEVQGDVRGGLIAIPRSSTEAHMPALVVDKHYLGWSIGTALLEIGVNQLRRSGYSVLSTIAPRDPEGGSFFKHRNWVQRGTISGIDFGVRDQLDRWELTL